MSRKRERARRETRTLATPRKPEGFTAMGDDLSHDGQLMLTHREGDCVLSVMSFEDQEVPSEETATKMVSARRARERGESSEQVLC